MANIFYIDGDFVPEEAAVIPANDLSILRGYGVFDFLRTYGGKPFRLEAHVQRLLNSAELIGMEIDLSLDDICAAVRQTLAKNNHAESNVRIVMTGGISPDNITPQHNGKLIVMATPLYKLPDWWYTSGAKLVTVETERNVPGAKSINYIPAIMALKVAREQNAIEAIYVNRHTHVLEGTTTNLFAFFGEQLVTPPASLLPGITRQVVMELVEGVFPLELRDITVEELYEADEVFITASNKEVVPIIQVNDQMIADGTIGEKTQTVMQLFREHTQQFALETV